VLDLRRWYLPEAPFKSFLTAHTHTLRELPLLAWLSTAKPLALASWGAHHLQLTGIELTRNPHGGDLDDTVSEDFDNIEPHDQNVEAKFQLEPRHETIWLGGRRNAIRRETHG